MNQKEIVNREYLSRQTLLSSRTIGQALKMLLEYGLIERIKSCDKNKDIDKRLVKYRLIDRGGFFSDL
jgi:Fic family protein